MIITRTPFRVSLLGGGSDLRKFYCKNGYGAVISSAIKQYMYVVIHPYFQNKIRIKYSRTEDVEHSEQVQHPIVRECLKKVKIERGVEIASFADIPSGTGLGSSSSFTVGMLNALYAYKGMSVTKERLAAEACEIEIDILGEPIGKQDQYAAAYGDLRYMEFRSDEKVDLIKFCLTRDNIKSLEHRLCLYYIGGKRKASDILKAQSDNIANESKFNNLKKMVSLTSELKNKLNKGNISDVGELLHRGWLLKKELAEGISNVEIDSIYYKSLRHGAIGGKLLGAGGAGFLLLFSEDHNKLQQTLGCKFIQFAIDTEGSKVIFHD